MGAPRTWPLVGRDAELATIDRARRDGRAGVIVSGATGVGKSRLAAEALRVAAREGAPTGRIVATETAREVPLSAFVVLLPAGMHGDDLFVTMQRATEWIAHASRGRPLVLVVDDAQWLDAASAVLLHHLVVAEVVFVVATVRDDGPVPGAIASIWKDTDAVRIDLGGLDREQTATLAAAVLHGTVDHVVRRWLWESTRGNPLYIRELLTQAEGDGTLTSVEGVWTLDGTPRVAPSLQELLTARMAHLSAEATWALALLALGEPLTVSELSDLVGGGDALHELENRGLIDLDEGADRTRVRLAHPMYAESVRQGLRPLSRRRAADTLARLLMAREHAEPGDTLRIALLLIDAGEEPSTELLLDAADEANRKHAPRIAADLAGRVRARGAGGPRAALALSRALVALRRHEEALAVLRATEPALDSPDVALDYLEVIIDLLYWGMRDADAAHELLSRAASWWPGDEWLRRLEPLRLRTLAFEANGGPASADLDPSRDSGQEDDRLRSELEPLRVASLLRRGRVQEAYALSATWSETSRLPGMTAVIARAMRARTVMDSGIGWARFDDELLSELDRCVDSQDSVGAGQAAYALSMLRRARGSYRDARTFAVEAELRLREQDPFGVLPVAVCLQAEYACFTGRRADAQRLLISAERLCGSAPLVHQAPFLARARAWATYAEGDETRAQRMLIEAAAETEQALYSSGLYHEALRAGAPPRDLLAPLLALRNASDSPFSQLFADETRAAADDDGAALEQIVDAYEGIGAIRDAAEAAALAASAFARTGRLDSSRRAAARSRSLVPAHQGASAPRSLALDGVVVTLTPRERQIAQLASEGHSNAEIATRLRVSVRTVESHLYRAMHKVGASDRRDIHLG